MTGGSDCLAGSRTRHCFHDLERQSYPDQHVDWLWGPWFSMSFAYESVWSRARLPPGEVSIVTGEGIRTRKEEAQGGEVVKRRE